jgi:thiol-disulfide isomerase/thioredoxin
MKTSKYFWLMLSILLLTLAAKITWQPVSEVSAASNSQPFPLILYFFWGEGCPHCLQYQPLLDELVSRFSKLQIRSYEVFQNKENMAIFEMMATRLGFDANSVPTLIIDGKHWIGYTDQNASEIKNTVAECALAGCPDAGAGINFSTGKVSDMQGSSLSQIKNTQAIQQVPEGKQISNQSIITWINSSSNRYILGFLILGILLAASLVIALLRSRLK